MPYTYVKECLRSTLHTSIDYLIPSTPFIGLVSTGVGVYAHGWMILNPGIQVRGWQGFATGICLWFSESFAPTFLEKKSHEWSDSVGNFLGYQLSILFVPKTNPYFAEYFAVASSLATTLTLNLIAQALFGTNIKKEGKSSADLVQSLNHMGLAIPVVETKEQSPTNSAPFPFKDLIFLSEPPKPVAAHGR